MKRGVNIGIFGLTIAVALIACDGEQGERPPRRTPPQAPAADELAARLGYRVVEVEDGGSIAGNVRWVGPLPEPGAVEVRVNRELCGETQPARSPRVSSRGGLAETIVWIAGVNAGLASEPPAQPPTILAQGCRYVPHVLAVGVGWTIVLRNEDAVLHNVHAFRTDDTVWDFALPAQGSSESRVVESAGALRVLSDVHSWMEAWIHAFPHPYFAVTAQDGRFRIQGVPPGQYVVRVWHEGWRIVGTAAGRPQYSSPVILARSASVSPRQETTLDFELSLESGELAGE